MLTMRMLTRDEEVLRQHRREQFAAFVEERRPILVDFAERLRLPEPGTILSDPERHLVAIAAFMKNQTVREEDRIWILTRIACFVGELFVHRFSGSWFLNEIPDSRYFLQIVAGRFRAIKGNTAMVAPFEIAAFFLGEQRGRDLAHVVDAVERELLAA